MKELNSKEMLEIDGGIDLNSALIGALVKTAEICFELGQSVGSSIRRAIDNCMA